MSSKPSHYIWYELMTTDADAAARFYGAVVGWSVVRLRPDRQGVWSVVDGGAAGRRSADDPDRRRRTGHASGVGGLPLGRRRRRQRRGDHSGRRRVWMPANDVPGVGRMALVADPQGAGFYVMTPIGDTPSPSFTPGRPGFGGWNELHTTDWQAAFGFYAAQFGWGKTHEMDMGPMGTYLLFNIGRRRGRRDAQRA